MSRCTNACVVRCSWWRIHPPQQLPHASTLQEVRTPHTRLPRTPTSGRLLQAPVTLVTPSPPPLPDPGLPPGVFSADVRQRGLEALPDGSMVQTIRFQNNSILSRTIPPPAPPLPPGIDPNDVANRTFVRGNDGGWAQNVTLTNGTVVEQQAVPITAPPQPTTLTDAMIRTRVFVVRWAFVVGMVDTWTHQRRGQTWKHRTHSRQTRLVHRCKPSLWSTTRSGS